ncbi:MULTISPECIES: response regulator transcription factor [Paenibacillus]|uniref:Response regulator n=1 Tax=Paenibacillus albilobatus TaxID=2716884 RepID=A0A919XNW4_9BACL|nr:MULTISPECIES: response regulator [Paenibacillus]GIO34087.1 hypothetical protein J2TS6_52280 [Paenibacillus albilobatus]
MYKVLIVDDESWVVESLKACVDWGSLGFEVAGAAHNGLEALQNMESTRPEVVFTDIRMPGMTGLELIKKGSELPSPPKFVVISGYAEFAYAQRALNFGASAYCLKPYDEQEIAGVLGKLKKALDAERFHSESRLLHLLTERNEAGSDSLQAELMKWGLQPGPAIGALVAAFEDGTEPEAGQGLSVKIGRSKTLRLMDYDQLETAARILQTQPGFKGAGISYPCGDAGMLKRAIETAYVLSNQYFMTGKPGIFKHREDGKGEIKDCIRKLGAAIGSKDVPALLRCSDEIKALFRGARVTVKDALHLYNAAFTFLYSVHGDENDGMLLSYEQLMDIFPSGSDMIDYVNMAVMKGIGKNPGYGPKETGNETFKTMLQYVHENYRSAISIQTLTQKYYIHPNYISQLFKKETGETFTSYITRLRITYACELLEQTEDLVSEIAEKAGYQDYFYFTRMFKKVTGRTPTQFREQFA